MATKLTPEQDPLAALMNDKADAASIEEPEMVKITMDLAPCQGLGIAHNGHMFLHGGTYTVTTDVAADLKEIQNRGHSHEASITKQETAGRRRRNLDVHTPLQVRNPVTGGMQMF